MVLLNLPLPKPCTKQWTTRITNLSIEITFEYNCPTLPEECHLALQEVDPLQALANVSTVEPWVTGLKNVLRRTEDVIITVAMTEEMTEIVEMIETVETTVEMDATTTIVETDAMTDETTDEETTDEMTVEEEISVILATIEMIAEEEISVTRVMIGIDEMTAEEEISVTIATMIEIETIVIVVTTALKTKKLTVSVRMALDLSDVIAVVHVIEIHLILIREIRQQEDILLIQILMKESKIDWRTKP